MAKKKEPLLTIGEKYSVWYEIPGGTDNYRKVFTLTDITEKDIYIFERKGQKALTFFGRDIPNALQTGIIKKG